MTYAEQLTAQIRQAHITALKQRYLDLIEGARIKKEASDRQYFDDTKQAYADKQREYKNTPQKLSALGISGGRGDDELASIAAEYDETMAKLKRRRDEFIQDYEWMVQKQTRLMNNDISEYNARIALEDYNSSRKSSGSRSSGNGGSQQKVPDNNSGSGSGGGVISPEVDQYMKDNGYLSAPNRRKSK